MVTAFRGLIPTYLLYENTLEKILNFLPWKGNGGNYKIHLLPFPLSRKGYIFPGGQELRNVQHSYFMKPLCMLKEFLCQECLSLPIFPVWNTP